VQTVKTKKKILFLSHDSSRTGAPMVLLNFLEWLKKQNIYDLEILSKKVGPLEVSFRELAVVHSPVKKNILKRGIKKVVSKITRSSSGYKLPSTLSNKKFDLIYLNTIDCLDITRLLFEKFNCPIICHVHENDFTIKAHYPNHFTENNISYITRFIAVSKSTKNNLINNHNIPEEKISLVYELINAEKIKQPTISVKQVKAKLGLANEFIVGGSGLSTWRKGIDLFVQVAIELNKIKPGNNIKLIWVGNIEEEQFRSRYDYESQLLGVNDKIIFTGVVPDVQNYFQIFDVFALTSREDPFPLVALEAAAQKKPIILFDNSGGMPELFEHGEGGIVVPYVDVVAMANAILDLQSETDKISSMGIAASQLVNRFDVNIIGKQLVKEIQNVLN